jgi:cytochrome c peroxidase
MSKIIGVLAIVVAASVWGSTAVATEFVLTPKEELGRFLFFDKISEPNSMSCAECHGPSVGFTGPIPGVNRRGAVYRGAIPQRFGNRKPPSASYATVSPVFDFDAGEGLFIGGNFWDGRATGEHLGNPAADQALGPFLNPVEQNNPSKQVVLEKVAGSSYASLWEVVWGEPLAYGTPAEIEENYDRIGRAIGEFEASPEVNQFSSKFDVFWENAGIAGMNVAAINIGNWQDYSSLGLSRKELEGLALFNDESKGKCALCHVLDPVEGASGNELPPVFTDFSFDNLGVPKNLDNPFYDMDEVYLDDGSPINPEGAAWIDPGLGGFLENHPNPAWQAMAAENYGKHKVPTLRNVAKAPSENFTKAYMHNGVFKSLREVVHFYNTRDVEDWPDPEVPENVNTDELGDLGLSRAEEKLIVQFMGTLSDGYNTGRSHNTRRSSTVFDQPRIAPNPFTRHTTLDYSLPSPGSVEIHVFNVAGQRVATLVDGFQESGRHTTRFVADGLPNGVYFVRLTTEHATATTKAIVLE